MSTQFFSYTELHTEIKSAARMFEKVAVIDRPADLSGDRVADGPVLKHALAEMEKVTGCKFD